MEKWGAVEIGLEGESPNISLAGSLKDFRGWTCGYNVGKCVEATHSRCCCKPFQPLIDHHFAINDFDGTKEDIKAVHDESGDRKSVV